MGQQMLVDSSNKKILVVEDDVDLNNTYSIVLRKEGLDVSSAKDGLEAIKLLDKFTPDLVLLDLRMAKMGGVEFLKESNIANNLPNTKIIIFTNFDLNDEIQEAFELGASRYVLKAMLSPKQLVKLVEEELDIEVS
ncbi:MAG: response regulator [Acidimicrobiia bacterium]|nr:response regulator [Acidimicrobiia bacterium]